MSGSKAATYLAFSLLIVGGALPVAACAAAGKHQATTEAGDIPRTFVSPSAENDYIRRVEMIPMRDGVKLYTVIVIPKGVIEAPIVLTRTPYNANVRGKRAESATMLGLLPLADEALVAAGYIRVYQDVRGKSGSEGVYQMTRPVRGPLNPTAVDHSTDAWDTIDWLVKNVSESNGKVGMIGSSYDGFTVAMALLEPHPALKAAVPESPMIDGWMGDDWFHYGVFRQPNLDYFLTQTKQRDRADGVPRFAYDDYETFMRYGSPGAYADAKGLSQLPWWRKLSSHPSYDDFWRGQALDKLIAARPSTVPTLWEQGLWDQEDMWGANHVFAALKAAGHETNNWLVMGPWHHSQAKVEGDHLGPLRWNGDTALQYRRDIVLPFFNEHLKGGPPANLARATVYNPAENRWQKFDTWPVASATVPIYLTNDFGLSFKRPPSAFAGDSYVSDPAKPVAYLPRPVRFSDRDSWRTWLIRDQRFVDGRPDVLVYQTAALSEPVKIQGAPIADIVATTSGTDADFVVKLIDVYPPNYPSQPELGGYQLPIAIDIFRGRYRESFEHPSPIPPGKPQHYRFALPNQNYVFMPGHRIMVQIQSTLFPLYERNPQSYVDNPLFARLSDYKAETITVLHSSDHASAIYLPIVP